MGVNATHTTALDRPEEDRVRINDRLSYVEHADGICKRDLLWRIADRPRQLALRQEYAMAGTRRRSDPDIFSAARKALDDHPSVPPEVRVHVDGGTVTLTGSVR
jgi:hypothetical protein